MCSFKITNNKETGCCCMLKLQVDSLHLYFTQFDQSLYTKDQMKCDNGNIRLASKLIWPLNNGNFYLRNLENGYYTLLNSLNIPKLRENVSNCTFCTKLIE